MLSTRGASLQGAGARSMVVPSRASCSRSLATASNFALDRKVRQNNWEEDAFIEYKQFSEKLSIVRNRLQRPLTYAEKVLYSHLDDPHGQDIERGSSYLRLRPDRLALPDASGQMSLLQFMSSGIPSVKKPTTVHCDHLIQAQKGATEDLERSLSQDPEIYSFLESVCAKYGIGFWKPGSGIVHQVLLENYAFPGGLLIGTDSHTPNAGGLGTCAIGCGGADGVEVMADLPWELKAPKIIGVKLTGQLSGWTAPKDIILKIAGLLTSKGGTNHIVEYYGSGTETISATGMATCCNMGAELGATTSIFPFTEQMYDYLAATQRKHVGDYARTYAHELRKDDGAEYDQHVEINLSELEPHINGPFTPDLATPVSKLKATAEANGWPTDVSVGLIGSCTNSSYEDMSRAASIARDALDHGVKAQNILTVTPGSEQIRATIDRDGQLETLKQFGSTVLANACGPCIGNWDRQDTPHGVKNTIISSFNRNFTSRNDGNPNTHAFVASPDMVVAMSAAGTIAFNPLTDTIKDKDGNDFKLSPPSSDGLPPRGYVIDAASYQAPPSDRSSVEVSVSPTSERLQLITPFAPWDGKNATGMPILIKAQGKTTTDHISMAGPWLKYRGHLDNISNNMLIGATNAANGKANEVLNETTGKWGPVPETARDYKTKGLRWVVIGDWNYGEGSSREHAAIEPRHLGAFAVVCRSIARIHEVNLKKQGLLALTFSDPVDYDRIMPEDTIDISCTDLAPGQPIYMTANRAGSESFTIELKHSLNSAQIQWFKDGSMLNTLTRAQKGLV